MLCVCTSIVVGVLGVRSVFPTRKLEQHAGHGVTRMLQWRVWFGSPSGKMKLAFVWNLACFTSGEVVNVFSEYRL